MYIRFVEMISTSQIVTNYIPQQENAIRHQIISVVILQYKINWLSLQGSTYVTWDHFVRRHDQGIAIADFCPQAPRPRFTVDFAKSPFSHTNIGYSDLCLCQSLMCINLVDRQRSGGV